jgi:hypothetical protein
MAGSALKQTRVALEASAAASRIEHGAAHARVPVFPELVQQSKIRNPSKEGSAQF